jgi:hypothetical protein
MRDLFDFKESPYLYPLLAGVVFLVITILASFYPAASLLVLIKGALISAGCFVVAFFMYKRS